MPGGKRGSESKPSCERRNATISSEVSVVLQRTRTVMAAFVTVGCVALFCDLSLVGKTVRCRSGGSGRSDGGVDGVRDHYNRFF